MSWIFVDKEKGGEENEMRQKMRRNMRDGRMRYMGGSSMRDGNYSEGYRQGYKHGWEDHEDEEDENYRRARDSRGRYI